MTLRHISPRSSDWADAMDEGAGGWEKLGPEEREKLRLDEYAAGWLREGERGVQEDEADYGWVSASDSR